jgi:hypothetical protein
LLTERGFRQIAAAAKKMEKPKLDRASAFVTCEELNVAKT